MSTQNNELPQNPSIESETVKPFRRFCTTIMTIGSLPSSYQEAMSYQEMLLWLCDFIENTVIPAFDNNANAITELQNLYVELKDYVDNYFTNLDVQEEINNKLDEMVSDGTLYNIMKPYFDEVDKQIENLNDTLDNYQEQTNQNYKVMQGNLNNYQQQTNQNYNSLRNQLSDITAGAGNPESSSAEIIQARTNIRGNNFSTLNDRIDFIEKTLPFNMQNISDVDFNTILLPGKYIVTSVSANNPKINGINLGTSGILIVEASNPDNINDINSYHWIKQSWISLSVEGTAERIIQRTNTEPLTFLFKEWRCNDYNYLNKLYNKLDRENLSDYYNTVSSISSNVDINDVIKTGIYIVTQTTNANLPIKSSGVLQVETYYNTNNTIGKGNAWVVQTFQDITLSKLYKRLIRVYPDSETEPIINDWRLIFDNTSYSSNDFGLNNKKIVNFGDSLFGNYRDNTSISYNIQQITGAEVINMGFGGCRMSNRSDANWNAFGMCALADAITTHDFTLQDNAINNPNWSDKPSYFNDTLTQLKSIDFSEIDYITISYGTNDYWAGALLDNEENKYDKNTFCGALRYSLETILNKYPNIRILIGCPIWRAWLNDDKTQILSTSDERTFAGGYTIPQMNEAEITTAKEYHIKCLDLYNTLGFNKFNYSNYFPLTNSDLVHPNEFGRYCMAREYAFAISSM